MIPTWWFQSSWKTVLEAPEFLDPDKELVIHKERGGGTKGRNNSQTNEKSLNCEECANRQILNLQGLHVPREAECGGLWEGALFTQPPEGGHMGGFPCAIGNRKKYISLTTSVSPDLRYSYNPWLIWTATVKVQQSESKSEELEGCSRERTGICVF